MEDFSNVKPDVNFNVPVSDKTATSPVIANAETVTSSTLEAPDTLRQPYVPTLVHEKPLNPPPQRQNTIDWLLELGLPPLPVAPAQDPHTYPLLNKKGEVVYEKDGVTPKPKFTGKNPSYLDENDIPHTVSHGKYQKRQPTKEELDTWFANPLNGVGSLGSDKWAFVDLDRHKFDAPELTPEQSQELCDETGKRIIEAAYAQTQKLPPYERTQSGGWRVVVGLSKPPTFTNFCLTPGGVHVGEVLGKGRFAVLAPTVGPTGQSYEAYHRCPPDEIPVVDELEKLTLHPVKASQGRSKNAKTTNDSQPTLTPVSDSSTPNVDGSTPNVDRATSNVDGSTPNVDASCSNSTSNAAQILEKYPQIRDKVFDLRDLGTDTTRDVLVGVDKKNDRSGSLTTAVNDWYGWENWCRANGITYRGDTRSLALEAGDKLKLDDLENRVDRILDGIDGNSRTTSCEFKGGSDEGCWRRILKLAGVKGSKRFFDEIFTARSVEGGKNEDDNAKVDAPIPPVEVSGSQGKPTRQEIRTFSQKFYTELFEGTPYIYVFGQFHQWVGTHYEPVHIAVLTKQIHDFCDKYWQETEDKKTGELYLVYPYADPVYVDRGLKWLKQKVGIDPKLVNPPGLNCIDGFLQLSYDPDGGKWIRTLKDHDPQTYCLYAPQATYHIPAILKSDACDRLLECLDPMQQDIFLKTIGAGLDLETVRIVRGRGVRAIFLEGLGNNGKDTLRELTSLMFGRRGMVSVSLSDFMQYDGGRKFPLQKLDGALVNWPSENADNMLLERIQTLKIAISGEELSGEQKGQNEYPFYPRCVHIFNLNSPPRLQGSMEAIRSRFAILKLTKTYTTNPAPGELQADPRFRYDPEFLRREVLPWYLHYVLNALDLLMVEGIDYEATEQAWDDLRAETDHIYEFSREVGIGYKTNAQLGAEEVFNKLREWYIQTGALEVEDLGDGRQRDRWSPNPSWGDNLIKGRNQIFARLLKIFPKARRERDGQGRNILVGIGWIPPSPIDPKGGEFDGTTVEVFHHNVVDSVSDGYVSEHGLNVPEDGLKMFNPSNGKGSEDAEDVLGTPREKNNPHVVSPTLIQKAYAVAEEMAACTTKADAKAVLAKYGVIESERPLIFNLLSESGRELVANLLSSASNEVNEIKEAETQNHLQHLQNGSTTGVTSSSGDVQTSSDHVQNGNVAIQNLPCDASDAKPSPTTPTQKRNLNANYRYCGADKCYGSTMLRAGTLLKIVSATSDPEIFVVNVIGGNGERLEVKYEDLLWTEKDNPNG